MALWLLQSQCHYDQGCTKLRNETKYYETQRNILNCETTWNEYNETKRNILKCETQ